MAYQYDEVEGWQTERPVDKAIPFGTGDKNNFYMSTFLGHSIAVYNGASYELKS